MATNNALDTIELLTRIAIAQISIDKRNNHLPVLCVDQIRPLITKFAGTGIHGTIDESEIEVIATNIKEKICFDSPCNH